MKLINIIFAVLSLAVLSVLSSCMDEKPDPDYRDIAASVTIQLFLSGTVYSASGEYLSSIRVEDQGTGNYAVTDENGTFVLQSSKKVTVGNIQEIVNLKATDANGYFATRTFGVVIGEWAGGQATIRNIQIIMEPVSLPQ